MSGHVCVLGVLYERSCMCVRGRVFAVIYT